MYVDLIPAHTIAHWLLKHIDHLLDHLGLQHEQTAEEIIYVAIIIAASLLVGTLVKKVILFITQKAVAIHDGSIGRELLQQRTLVKCSHVIPPLVFLAMLPFAFVDGSKTLDIIGKVAVVYTLVCVAIGIVAVFHFIFYRINARENSRNLPLKGILNIAIGIVWIVIVIIAVSVLIDKSPVALLTGLGAFAAVLSLIFKDTIMGFVAGIQMSENDMLRVGDWVVIQGTQANGIVEDVTLSTVKIRNFDKTLVMVPPYTLVSTSIQNYRGMWESGVRRIYESLIVDLTTVVPCDPERVARVGALHPELASFIADSAKAPDRTMSQPGIRGVSGSTLTNLGLFRAYICLYLAGHPKISKNERIMVRLQEPNDSGVPLNIWAFTATTDWDEYEGILSGVLEHIIMSAEEFGLGIYSSSSLTVTDVPPAHTAAGVGLGHSQHAAAAGTDADAQAEK
ncbi:MAG: mechanosensitive ion channel family protein [Muribaculaceae bacterium]|nr:mechanosensitive ion channel family protein [Muribaculaceae bacterium]MDE6331267.1 mechanosensitive ion channel family protein [Muribaculaceae bacterium]